MESVLKPQTIKTFRDADAVTDLRHKVIREFHDVLCQLSKGYSPNYETILEEISLIELLDKNYVNLNDSLFIIQYYLNK